jgi:hypothetical protein
MTSPSEFLPILAIIVISSIGYFFIVQQKKLYNPVYCLFMIYQLFRKIDEAEQKSIAKSTLDFCESAMGKLKTRPSIEISDFNKYNFDESVIGFYAYGSKKIAVNKKLAYSQYRLIRTVLHEYGHHVQHSAFLDKEYSRITSMAHMTYEKHPWEVQARWYERRYLLAAVLFCLKENGYI